MLKDKINLDNFENIDTKKELPKKIVLQSITK